MDAQAYPFFLSFCPKSDIFALKAWQWVFRVALVHAVLLFEANQRTIACKVRLVLVPKTGKLTKI